MQFRDRHQAGELLGLAVSDLEPPNPVVLALPRGGLPVAVPVAAALGCDLDVLVVRKLGVPQQPEFAMGALGEGGVLIRNEDVINLASVDQESFDRVVASEARELERRLALYRSSGEPTNLTGMTAIIVDDGLATGSTALAAVAVLRERGPLEVWVAVPVAPTDTTRVLEREADRVVVLHRPRPFGAVGAWYSDFRQTTDAEVRNLLDSYGDPSASRED